MSHLRERILVHARSVDERRGDIEQPQVDQKLTAVMVPVIEQKAPNHRDVLIPEFACVAVEFPMAFGPQLSALGKGTVFRREPMAESLRSRRQLKFRDRELADNLAEGFHTLWRKAMRTLREIDVDPRAVPQMRD